MITIEQVIEQCARDVECLSHSREHAVARIRALKEQYEGCIVAEGDPVPVWVGKSFSHHLYRAREAK